MTHDALKAQFEGLWAAAAPRLHDAWAQAVADLADSPPSRDDLERICAKMLAGHIENDGDIIGFRREDFRVAIQEEKDDLIGYRLLEWAILGPPR